MAAAPDLEGLLRSKLFHDLALEDVRRIGERGSTRTLEAGQALIEEGQTNTQLYVVVRGELKIYLPPSQARFTQVNLGKLGPGDCIGEYSFIDKRPASASVSAQQQTEVFQIAQAEFERILQSDPGVGKAVYKNLLHLLIARLRRENQFLDFSHPS